MLRLICRVCGAWFATTRSDALTCTNTCRQRLRRGQAFAYLAGLTARERRMHERYHSTMDDARAADKKARAAQGRRRAIRREEREKRAEQERERFVAETVGRATIKVQKQGEQRAVVATVAGTLKLFVRERRNDMSAEAMAAFLDKPHFYSADAIAAALEELRASGEYDRIVAEAGLPAAPLQHLPVSG